jgi:hypothetical protein
MGISTDLDSEPYLNLIQLRIRKQDLNLDCESFSKSFGECCLWIRKINADT